MEVTSTNSSIYSAISTSQIATTQNANNSTFNTLAQINP